MPKNPLIIYIAETDHGDMSYSSLLRQVIEDCDSKELKLKVFSEFGNKEMGLGSQDEKLMTQAENLSNVPDPETHEATKKLLNERSIQMGNLYKRFDVLIRGELKSLPEDATPATILEQRRDYIDNPEILKLLEAEAALRQENEKTESGEIGSRNSAGKNGEDCEKFWGNGNAFVHKTAHEEMARDVLGGVTGDEDVIVIIAGSPHIYGLNKELGNAFEGSKKLVVGNLPEMPMIDLKSVESIRRAQLLVGKTSCQAVGEVAGFEIDPVSKKAIVPELVTAAIQECSREETFVERLGLKPEEAKESWVDKMHNRAIEKTVGYDQVR